MTMLRNLAALVALAMCLVLPAGAAAQVADPAADFSADPLSGPSPLNVDFTNESDALGATYEWDFGDETTSTEETPPPHTYTEPGLYTVTLTVTDALNRTDTETK